MPVESRMDERNRPINPSTFGALLVGYRTPQGELVYAGKVGTGYSRSFLVSFRKRLGSTESSGNSLRPGYQRASTSHPAFIGCNRALSRRLVSRSGPATTFFGTHASSACARTRHRRRWSLIAAHPPCSNEPTASSTCLRTAEPAPYLFEVRQSGGGTRDLMLARDPGRTVRRRSAESPDSSSGLTSTPSRPRCGWHAAIRQA